MLAYVRKFIVVLLGNGAIIGELELIPHGKEAVIILTAIATMLGVYAVPNAGGPGITVRR